MTTSDQLRSPLLRNSASSVTLFIAGVALLFVLTGGLVMLFNRRTSAE